MHIDSRLIDSGERMEEKGGGDKNGAKAEKENKTELARQMINHTKMYKLSSICW